MTNTLGKDSVNYNTLTLRDKMFLILANHCSIESIGFKL